MKRHLVISLAASAASVVIVVWMLSVPHTALAATCAWTGNNSTDWADAGNWSDCGGGTPGAADAVVINSAANQPILSNAMNATIASLAINSSASVQVGGALTLTSGSGFTQLGRLDLQTGGMLNVQTGGVVSIGSDTLISGTLSVQNGALARFDLAYSNATITTTGVLTGGGDVLVTAIPGSAGSLSVYGNYGLGGQLTLASESTAAFYTPTLVARLSISPLNGGLGGTANVTVTQAMTWTGGNLNDSLTLAIGPDATLSVNTAGYVQLNGLSKLYNYGTINWVGGTFYAPQSRFINQPGSVFNSLGDNLIQGVFTNYGALNVLSGTLQTAPLRQYAGKTTLNGGNLKSNVILVGGTLMGAGTITGSLQNTFQTVSATIAPGNPLGALNITGDYFSLPGNTLRIELGGTTAGTTYDVLNVGGIATLNGALVISLVNGFEANAGDSFRVMNYGSRVSSINFLTITNALAATHVVSVNPDHVLIAEPAAYTRLSKRPSQTVSEPGTVNGYTLSAFNPTALTVTVSIFTDTLPAGFSYLSGSTSGATTADPHIDTSGGQQTLSWTGAFTIPPTANSGLNFGVFVMPALYGTYSNSAAIRVNSSVTDTHVISINNVAPVIVPLTATHNLSLIAPGGTVQNTNPPVILIASAKAGTVPITVIAGIVCPFNSCGALQNVFLVHGPISYTMHMISSTLQTANARKPSEDYGYWQGTVPGSGVIPGVPMTIFPDWDDHHPCSGPDQLGCVPGDPGPRPLLYDPSGHVTDANTSLPIANASVTLYRAPALQPDTRSETRGCPTINTRPGGLGGNWDSLPPATIGVGVPEDALLSPASIDPPVNPQLADQNGHYGWSVVTGCWFVVASAPGYAPKVSPLVGVPPEVTDLNIALQPLPNHLYLPVVVR